MAFYITSRRPIQVQDISQSSALLRTVPRHQGSQGNNSHNAASAAMGYTVDHFGWDGGFVLQIGACVLAMAFLAPTLWHKQVASQTREAIV